MGIMDMVRKFNDSKKEKSTKFKELQEDYRMQKMLEQRQKSSNERELERFYKEKREQEIKVELDKIRKQKKKELWSSKMFGGTTTINNIDRPILKEKNIFMNDKNDVQMIKQKGMFFK